MRIKKNRKIEALGSFLPDIIAVYKSLFELIRLPDTPALPTQLFLNF